MVLLASKMGDINGFLGHFKSIYFGFMSICDRTMTPGVVAEVVKYSCGYEMTLKVTFMDVDMKSTMWVLPFLHLWVFCTYLCLKDVWQLKYTKQNMFNRRFSMSQTS